MKTDRPDAQLFALRRAIVDSKGLQEFLGEQGIEMIIFPQDSIVFKEGEVSFPLTLVFKKEESGFSMEMIFLQDGLALDSAKNWVKPQEAVVGEELFYSDFWTGRPSLHAELGASIGTAIDMAINTMTGFFFHYFCSVRETSNAV